MSNSAKKIKLIVSGQEGREAQTKDRAGGETHGLTDWAKRKASEVEIDTENLKKNIQETLGSIDDVLREVAHNFSENWKLESISVGLSVSAEGSVGIATAGVETSIEVSFSPK